MAPKKPVAKKTAAKKPEAEEVKDDALPAVDAKVAQYEPEDLEKVNQLREAGIELNGTETSEDLDALIKSLEETDGAEPDEEDEDLPNRTNPRYETTQVEGKQRRFGVHFVLEKNGKRALYNENGVRISPVYEKGEVLAGSTDTDAWRSLARSAAKNNAERRRNMRPEDYLPG